MRELKFRAWSGDRYIEMSNLRGKRSIYFNPYELWYIAQSVDSKEVVLEQYTGLKDKNGIKIYEGDIVDYNDDGECIGVVKYDAPEFYLDADATNWARMFLKGAPHQKVIGNIHETPELLEDINVLSKGEE